MTLLSRNRIIVLVIVSLLAGILYSWIGSGSGQKGSSGRRLGTVKRGDLVQRVTVSGQIKPLRRTVFVAPYAGYINKIYVKVGQVVNQGDPIASIKSSLQSPEPVFPIRAPFKGVIVDVTKMEGEYVNEKDKNDVIARLDDNEHYYVIAKAPELDAARIKVGMDVDVRVGAISQSTLKGIVRSINLAAQDADGWKAQQATFEVRVEILNPPSDVRSGQSAILDIVAQKVPNVLYLEHEFINEEDDKNFVITKRGSKKFVTLGATSDLAAEVKEGLKEGDEVEQIDFLKVLEGAK